MVPSRRYAAQKALAICVMSAAVTACARPRVRDVNSLGDTANVYMPREGYVPPNGFVPDSLTAVRVARAIFVAVYGEQQIASEEPLTARLIRGDWFVTGHLTPPALGGVAEIKISKRDGRILELYHGK